MEKTSLSHAEVIRYFKEAHALPQEDKPVLIRMTAGFIRGVKTKQAYGFLNKIYYEQY